MLCPHCSHEVLPEDDFCGKCGEDLHALHEKPATSRIQKSILEDPLSAVPGRQPLLFPPEETVARAVEVMREKRRGCILVVDAQQNLIGIFTQRDLVRRFSDEGLDLSRIKLGEAMTPNPECLSENDPVAYALHIMSEGGFIHVPVIHESGQTAVLSVRGVLAHLTRCLTA